MLQRQAKLRSRAARLEALCQAEATGDLQPTQEHERDQEAAPNVQQMTYELQSEVDNELEAHFEYMDGPKDSPRLQMDRQLTRVLLDQLKSSSFWRGTDVLSDKVDSQASSWRLRHRNRRIEAWIDQVRAARAPGSLYSYREPEAAHTLSQKSYSSVPRQDSRDRQTFCVGKLATPIEAPVAVEAPGDLSPPRAPRIRNLRSPSLSSSPGNMVWEPEDIASWRSRFQEGPKAGR